MLPEGIVGCGSLMLKYNPIHMLDGIAFTSMTSVYMLHGMFFWRFGCSLLKLLLYTTSRVEFRRWIFSSPHLKHLGFTKFVHRRASPQAPYFLNDHGNT